MYALRYITLERSRSEYVALISRIHRLFTTVRFLSVSKLFGSGGIQKRRLVVRTAQLRHRNPFKTSELSGNFLDSERVNWLYILALS